MMRFKDKLSLDIKLFGERIREARERIRMSQYELAAELSRDQRAISEYENGKRRVAAVDVTEFARVLQVPILYFFKKDWGEDSLEEAILLEFNRLPSTVDKESAVELVRVLANNVHHHLEE